MTKREQASIVLSQYLGEKGRQLMDPSELSEKLPPEALWVLLGQVQLAIKQQSGVDVG